MTEEPVIRVRVLVEGRVQGVGFRYGIQREAARLGVSGWARNLPERRVEAVYEGPAAAVEVMLDWTRRGPQGAQVTGMTRYEEPPEGERGFGIR